MRKIVVNKEECLFKNKLIKIYINKEIRAPWLDKDFIEIIIPAVYKNKYSGKVIAYSKYNNKTIPLIVKDNDKIIFNYDFEELKEYILNEKFCKRFRPIQTYLPIHYHKIPFRIFLGKIQTKLALRKLKNYQFPKWPIEDSFEALLYINNKLNKKKNKKSVIILLSHDVDTEKGFSNILKFLDIEKKHKVISTYFIVGNYYGFDNKIFQKILENKNEIGLHGYNHDGKDPYLNKEKIEERIALCIKRFKEYGIKLNGFRAPSLSISDKLDKVLSKYFKYSSSTVDTELILPDAIKPGCCTLKPYYKNNILQIPITVPMESSLIFLGYNQEKILKLWIKKIEWIKKVGGIISIVTHTEDHFSANEKMLKIYDRLLTYLRKDKNSKFCTYQDMTKQIKSL